MCDIHQVHLQLVVRCRVVLAVNLRVAGMKCAKDADVLGMEVIMPRNEIGEIVNSLPIENMVAAPIIAAVKAQREISGMLAE